MPFSLGKGFCSDIRVSRINNRFLLLKRSRNEFEQALFEREKLFYEKIVPVFKILCRLVFNTLTAKLKIANFFSKNV